MISPPLCNLVDADMLETDENPTMLKVFFSYDEPLYIPIDVRTMIGLHASRSQPRFLQFLAVVHDCMT